MLCFCQFFIFALFVIIFVRKFCFKYCCGGVENFIGENPLFFVLVFVFVKRWGYASALKSLVLSLYSIRIIIDS